MIMASYRNTENGMRSMQFEKLPQVTDDELGKAVSDKFQQHMQEVIAEMSPKRVVVLSKFERIIQRICRVFRVTLVDLRSTRRDARSVFARQAIYYWARRLTLFSLPQIGRLMGGRDHTTVLYGVPTYVKKRLAMGRNLRVVREGRK